MKQYVVVTMIGICLFMVSFFSCITRKGSKELLHIESIMDEYPDSAFNLIKNIDLKKLSTHNRAWYYLLKTQVGDKNKRNIVDYDSIMNVALNYFTKHGDAHIKARAYFYAGKIRQKKKEVENALILYDKVLNDSIKYRDDYKLLYLVSYYSGKLYLDQEIFDEALKYYENAYRIMAKRDTLLSIYSLVGIADAYLYDKNAVKALEHYRKALTYTNGNYLSYSWVAFAKLSTAYDIIGNQAQALLFLSKAINEMGEANKQKYPLCLSKGILFMKANQIDSAYQCFVKAAHSTGLDVKASSLKWLSIIEEKKSNYKKSVEYLNQYNAYKDTISKAIKTKEIIRLKNNLEGQRLEIERMRLIHTHRLLITLGIVSILSLIVTILILCYRNSSKKVLFIHREKKVKDSENMHLKKTAKALELRNRVLFQTHEVELLAEQAKNMENGTERFVGLAKNEENIEGQFRDQQKESYWSCLMNERTEELNTLLERVIRGSEIGTLIESYDFSESETDKSDRKMEGFAEEDWVQFMDTIYSLVPKFVSRLKNNYPMLTEEEIRFCCLLKVRVKIGTIANILGISQDAVYKKINTILSKKMNTVGKKAELERILMEV